jgi:hypothetical protein
VVTAQALLDADRLADTERQDMRATFGLRANYPNPLSASTEITCGVPSPGEVRLTVHSPLRRPVRAPAQSHREVGSHRLAWDGVGYTGRSVRPLCRYVTERSR